MNEDESKMNEKDEKDEKDEKEKDIFYKKIKYFLENNLYVHITTKNKKFYNGSVEEVSPSFFILNDFIVGKIPIFYIEIREIEPYKANVK
ncbi:MAG: hypothetical protein QXO70_01890 [Candidatus Pacearchaeota archaeon]